MQFTIITVNPGGKSPTLDDISEKAKQALSEIMPVTYVPYSSFKIATESEPVALYIMDKKDKGLMSKEIKDVQTLQNNFFGSKKAGSYTTPMSSHFNPRYMVLDTHDISSEGYKDKFAIRLLMSAKIPVSHYTIARELAEKLSEDYMTTIFSLSKEKTQAIECVTQLEKRKEAFHALSSDKSRIIGNFTKKHKMSINKILAKLDYNIEVLMAPKDLEEYEGALRANQASMEYIKTLDESEQSKEMRQIRKDLAMIRSEISVILEMMKEEPAVISHYIRIFNPSELAKYKVRDVQLRESRKEVWS